MSQYKKDTNYTKATNTNAATAINLDLATRENAKYFMATGRNGKKYIPYSNTAVQAILNLSLSGNNKTGPVAAFNLPIEHSCNHDCECYKLGMCYAESGCYSFPANQLLYAENLKYFKTHSNADFVQAVKIQVLYSRLNLFRWFTCGDILNKRFFECMVEIARKLPGVRFWSYTKKYEIVNKWIDANGPLPANLVIIFSHWLNEDGSYFPMNNRHNLPTSEFIPFGREDLLKTVTNVCPCSDPDIFTTCATCPNPCYELKAGQSMGLCEHSTPRTKQRDAFLKQAKQDALKAGNFKLIAAMEKAAAAVLAK